MLFACVVCACVLAQLRVLALSALLPVIISVFFLYSSGARRHLHSFPTRRSSDLFASKGESARDVCLIPASAHGTNPASAQMMGLRIVVVACDKNGNVDLADLERKVAEHRARLAVLMITYPSTHGVFEEGIVRICEL